MGILLILAAESGSAAESSGFAVDWKVLLVLGLIIGVSVMMPRFIRRNRTERELLEKQYQRELNNATSVRSAADQILMQVVETGREINGVLDTKIRLLNKLIKDADDAARRLESLTSGQRPSERARLTPSGLPLTSSLAAYPGAATGKPAAPIAPVPAAYPPAAAEPAPQSLSSAQAAALAALASLRAAAGSQSPAPSTTTARPAPEPDEADAAAETLLQEAQNDTPAAYYTPAGESSAPAQNHADSSGSGRWKADIRSRIRTMVEEGRSVEEIARLTRLSKAEVNLMVDLMRSEG